MQEDFYFIWDEQWNEIKFYWKDNQKIEVNVEFFNNLWNKFKISNDDVSLVENKLFDIYNLTSSEEELSLFFKTEWDNILIEWYKEILKFLKDYTKKNKEINEFKKKNFSLFWLNKEKIFVWLKHITFNLWFFSKKTFLTDWNEKEVNWKYLYKLFDEEVEKET